ncbi:MAG: hypothetical protein AAF250_00900 [Pseudomonadota bacterium]
MSKLSLLLFAAGVLIAFFGVYSLIADGENSGFILIAGGIVMTAIAAGVIGKSHAKGTDDAG